MDWREIKDEKEKYAAYLCSREWSEKKEAVRKRAGGRCERCLIYDMDAVHHLNYLRKYNELLSDLQAICNACHDFTHGKCQGDPKNGTLHVSIDRGILLCPVCSFNCVHIGEHHIEHVGGSPVTVIDCWGECGHAFELCFFTHKGETECFTKNFRRDSLTD